MANMVLTIGGGKRRVQSSETYRDVSTEGKPVLVAASPTPEEYIEFLRMESPYSYSDISAITPDDDPFTLIATKLGTSYDNAKLRYESWKSASVYTVDRLVDVRSVQNSLRQIFTWIPGERILNPEFGSNLRKYLYEGITPQNIEAIATEIRHSVTVWEPRVSIDKVVNVQSVADTESNTVRLDVYYHVRGLSDKQFVYSYNYDYGAALV